MTTLKNIGGDMSESGIVLLLEDNPTILDLNRRMLEKEGVMVLTAKTIAEARERIKLAIPDVAVLDIMLPDGSGLDFLAELREVCDAPVLFLTAKAERADLIAGLTAGGNDYITKPYDIDEFCARIFSFLWLTGIMRKQQTPNDKPLYASVLSEKELTVAVLAAKGHSNKEIGEKVYLSESRVKTCLSGIYRKLDLSDKTDKRELLAAMLNVK